MKILYILSILILMISCSGKIEEIWLDDPEHSGLKLYYTDFIAEGLQLCEDK